jgi:hypothetical protein
MSIGGQLHSSIKLPPGKQPRCPLFMKLRRPLRQFRYYGEGSHFLLLGGIVPRFLGHPARSLAIMPTDISRLLKGAIGSHSAAPDADLKTRRYVVARLTTKSCRNRKERWWFDTREARWVLHTVGCKHTHTLNDQSTTWESFSQGYWMLRRPGREANSGV